MSLTTYSRILHAQQHTVHNRTIYPVKNLIRNSGVKRHTYTQFTSRYYRTTTYHTTTMTAKLQYPTVERRPTIDTYFGTDVTDHYEYLSQQDSTDAQQFVIEQNKLTQQVLQQCSSRDILYKRLTDTYNYERYSTPEYCDQHTDTLYYFKNNGLQNQSVLYRNNDVLLDPNTLAEDGTASLSICEFSHNGQYLAYGVSLSGSDWVTIYVMDVATKQLLSDKIEYVKFSGVSWLSDNSGFFYSAYNKPKSLDNDSSKLGSELDAAEMQQLYFHKLNTEQSNDVLIYSDSEHKTYMYSGHVSDDGKVLLISVSESTDPVNRLYYLPLIDIQLNKSSNIKQHIIKLIDNNNAQWRYVTNQGNTYYFKTNLNAPNYKLVSLDITASDVQPVDVIPETDDVLSRVDVVAHNKLIVSYMHNVSENLSIYNLQGSKLYDITLPDIGCISGLTAKHNQNTFYYSFTSFLYAGTVYSVTINNDTAVKPVEWRSSTPKSITPSDFKTEQVFYKSKDGTEIPMFILSKRNTKSKQAAPCILYGYGGFNVSLLPSFAVSRLVWIDQLDGIYAIPNIRGGGELGEKWHNQGKKLQKQNVFDDFIAAAEYLIDHKYTSKQQLAINGGSNGALLVGAVTNQRPDLFAVAVPQVGVLDMLKYHKYTIGYAWSVLSLHCITYINILTQLIRLQLYRASDYGRSDDNAEMFTYLYKYSPLHNIASNKVYPAVLVTTADHDDRVVPAHSFKYIAELQQQRANKSDQTAPLVARIESKAGHGAGVSLSKRIQEQADMLGFIAHYTGADKQ